MRREQRLVRVAVHQHRELVAAQPGRHVPVQQVAPQAGADLGQHRVADVVPAQVVDGLEAVHVDADQGLLRVAGLPEGQLQATAVRQAGQRVGVGQIAEVLLTLPELDRVAPHVAQRQELPRHQRQALDADPEIPVHVERPATRQVIAERGDHEEHRDHRVRPAALQHVAGHPDRAVGGPHRPGHQDQAGAEQQHRGQDQPVATPADAAGHPGRGDRGQAHAQADPHGVPPGPVRVQREHPGQPQRDHGQHGREDHRGALVGRRRAEQVRGAGHQHPADEPHRRGDDQPVQHVPERGRRAPGGTGQRDRAGQQGEGAAAHADRHQRGQGLGAGPGVVVVLGEQRRGQAGQGRRGDQCPTRGEQQMCPAGHAGVPATRAPEQRDRRDRGEQAGKARKLHTGR